MENKQEAKNTSMRKIILCRGIQGSGKTSYAKKWVLEDPDFRVRFNNDDVRNMLGKYWVPSRESLVSTIKFDFLNHAMNLGFDIIIDNMNLNSKEINFYKTCIEEFNKNNNRQYILEFKDFFIPVEECISRDARRENPIGESVIRQTWNKYRHFITTELVKKYVNNLKKQDTKLSKCIVLDMDNTLCFNTTKRPWYGEGSSEGMLKDIPNEPVCELTRIYKEAGYKIFIITGRDTSDKEATEQWLYNNNIPYDKIYYRTCNDFRKGFEIKKELVQNILNKYFIEFIIDDSTPIVEMYRKIGLTVLQPNKLMQ